LFTSSVVATGAASFHQIIFIGAIMSTTDKLLHSITAEADTIERKIRSLHLQYDGRPREELFQADVAMQTAVRAVHDLQSALES